MIRTGTVSILPAGAAAFARRRLSEALGCALLLGASLLFALLASYDPNDPSFNHATDATPENWLGAGGATLADLLMQGLGAGALVVVAGVGGWGWRLVRKNAPSRPLRRAAALAVCVALSCGVAAITPPPFEWPLPSGSGGVLGAAIASLLPPSAAAKPEAAALGAAAVALLAFVYALGLTRPAIPDFAALPGRAAAACGRARGRASLLLSRAAAWRPRLRPRIDDDPVAEPDPDAPPGPAKPAVVGSRAQRARTRAAKPASQPTFDFADVDQPALPALDLLRSPPAPAQGDAISRDALEQNARMLKTVLDDFGVRGEIGAVRPGPVITLYELEPAPGVKSARVIGLADDIARSMSAVSARVAVISGRNAIGVELPNHRRETVALRDLLASSAFAQSQGALNLALGKDIGGAPVIADLARMPHLLIAGTTGSGKSVGINAMILSLLYRLTPDQCKFILIDPKMLELSVYDGIPHLIAPVVTEPGKAVVALKWTVREMEERYRSMSQLGVRNIAGYNARVAEAKRSGEPLARRVQTGYDDNGRPVFEEQSLDLTPLPLIVVVVDEMADLMIVAGKEIETAVQRLSQMARAAGIHLIMATQRPSVDVITGTIKANFPTRVSFQVSSKIDSRTILGEPGAEQLLGQGDLLYMAAGGRVVRVHGPFVSDGEVEAVVRFLKAQGEPQYIEDVTRSEDEDAPPGGAENDEDQDDLYGEAVEMVRREGKVSTSFIQRRLQIGYNRAARMVERMEIEGLVTKADRVGRREVLGGDGGA